MSSGMVLADTLSVVGIYGKLCGIIYGYAAGYDLTHMADASACDFHGLCYFKSAVLGADHAKVTLLSAHGSIERSHIGDQSTGLAFF